MKALVSPSCRLDHVCEPVRYTARPVGSAKYRGFVGCTLNGPVAGLGSARRGDVPKTIVRHSTTIDVKTVLVLDCTMWLHSFWMTQSTRYQAFDLGRDGVRWQVTGRLVCIRHPSSHGCCAYTFVTHNTQFIRSIDYLHCRMGFRRSAARTIWPAENCRDGVTLSVVGP